MVIENILAKRYATPAITDIFSEEGKIRAERDLWIAVMKAQKDLGINIPGEDILKYERSRDDINLKLINEIERKTRHDVKAKIEAFVRVSGAGEHIHKGMTSRDLTDNVEQMQVRDAANVIFGKYVSVLRHFAEKSREYEGIILTARTHHQPAQPTLLGRRISMWGEEILLHVRDFKRAVDEYPLRGIKGAVGTQFDMLKLLGSSEKVAELERRVAKELGFNQKLESTGQVYYRSLDFKTVSGLALLSAGLQNFAIGMRLMSGYELVTEGFKEGQVGSSAMPHKMNTRSSERMYGFANLIKMYADGTSRLSGDQWEEGDVSCSVVRRVILPDALYASDGLCETALTVLNEMGVYPAIISRELDRYLPFLATTELLMTAVQAGMGREKAHELIKGYAVNEALEMRATGKEQNDLAERIVKDERFAAVGIDASIIARIFGDKQHFVGDAKRQIAKVTESIDRLTSEYAAVASYEPGNIL